MLAPVGLVRVSNVMALVGGIAIIINGVFGRDLRNDVEMPMSATELKDKHPPTKTARAAYILFGALLSSYGAFTFGETGILLPNKG